MMRAWFKKMGLREQHVPELQVGSIIDRLDPVSLFDLQQKLFSPVNRVLTSIHPRPTDNVVWDIVYEMMRDGVMFHVRRGKAFSTISRGPLFVALLSYLVCVLASAAGMVGTNASWHSPSLLALAVGAGTCSVGATLGLVWRFTSQR